MAAHLGKTLRPLVRYPVTIKGGPQRRDFFPVFWMRLVKSRVDSPPNIVTFHCPIQMTKFEIKSYLEKIYNIQSVKINTEVNIIPLFRNHKNERFKPKDDYKLAHVTLPAGETFEFPELYSKDDLDENEKTIKDLTAKQKEQERVLQLNGGISPWFKL